MKKSSKIALSVLSGILLACGWPEHGFPGLLFLGLIPLLIIEDDHYTRKQENSLFSIFWYGIPAFVVWNALATFWIYNSTFVGIVAAVLINTLLLSTVFILFHFTHRVLAGKGTAYIALIGYWLS
jgi:apolipoprotein N-acyltransferase